MTMFQRQLEFWKDCPESKLTRDFRKFHEENPHVFTLLLQLARDTKARGFEHYAINTLFEVMRWHTDMQTTDKEFKINNNHRPYYARLIMQVDKNLKGFFRTREAKADEEYS